MDPHNERLRNWRSKLTTVKVPLWASLIALVMFLGAVVFAAVSHETMERRYERQAQALRTSLETDRAAAMRRARDTLAHETRDAYRLFGTALAWSIRGALMRKNLDELAQYFAELVKDERIRLALLADQSGRIVASTDQHFKGAPFTAHFPAAMLGQKGVSIEPAENGWERLVIPIHGLNERLGTALVLYQAPRLVPE